MMARAVRKPGGKGKPCLSLFVLHLAGGGGVKGPGGQRNDSYTGSCQGQAASCLQKKVTSLRATLASVSRSVKALIGLPSNRSHGHPLTVAASQFLDSRRVVLRH